MAAIILLGLAGCGDGATAPSEWTPPEVPPPVRAISDAFNGGNPHFYFLPPVVPSPTPGGTFDGSLSPRVEICESDLTACTADPFAVFTFGEGAGDVRIVPEDEQYILNWHAGDWDLEAGAYYRITVFQASFELGYVDVLIDGQGGGRNAETGDAFQLKDGRTLPLKLRIEEGAASMAPASASTPDGAAAVHAPPGALDDFQELTVEPVDETTTELPDDGSALPGSVYDFGPDGLEFEEPVELTLAYDPATLPVGVVEDGLRVYVAGPDGWELLPGGAVDLTTNRVTGLTTHFSSFAILPGRAQKCQGSGYGTLEEALADIGPEGTITVCDGTHAVEGVVLDKPVTIRAEAGATPVLQTTTARAALVIDGIASGSVVLDGLTFQYSTPHPLPDGSNAYAIQAENEYDQVVIQNSTFTIDPGSRGSVVGFTSTVPTAAITIDDVDFDGGQRAISTIGIHLGLTNSQVSNHSTLGVSISGPTAGAPLGGATALIQDNSFADCGTRCVRPINGTDADVIGNTFGHCGSQRCVSVGSGSHVDVLSNTFAAPTLIGDPGPDPTEIILITQSSSALIQGNTFGGCGWVQCISVSGGSAATVSANELTAIPGGVEEEFAAVLSTYSEAATVFENNVVNGCPRFCYKVVDGGDATIRNETVTTTAAHGTQVIFDAVRLDPARPLSTILIEDNVVTGSGLELGVAIFEAANGTANRNTFSNLADGIEVHGGSTLSGRDNVFELGGTAVSLFGGSADVRFNDFTGQTIDVGAVGDGTSDLTCNWWGDASGPRSVPGPTDVYTPWALAPMAGTGATDCAPAEIRVAGADDGSGLPFVPKVATAVALVAPDGVVHVSDGSHAAEGVVLDKPVTIRAEAGATPVVQTSTELAALWVDGYAAGTVVIDGLTFDFDTPTGPDIPTRSYAIRAQNTYDQLVVRNSTFDVDPAARGGIFTEHSSVTGSATLVETSQFGGGVYGITTQDGHLDVSASQFLGVGGVGILYFGSTEPSSGRVENSTFDDCGSSRCVWALHGADVEVVSNDFITPAPTGDSGPDQLQVLGFALGATALVEDNDFTGCAYYRCILGATGAWLTISNNRFEVPVGGGALADPQHAVMIFHSDVTADVLNNQITGCWVFCIAVQPNAVATIRGNTMTIPDGHPPIAAAIFGNGGADLDPGSVPDPADAPVLVIEDNVVEALGPVADISDVGDYQIDYGVWLQNAVATSVSGNTIRRATVGFRVLENAEIQAGLDNVVETAVSAVQTSHIFGDGIEQPEDDGRVVMHQSDFLDYHNSIWGRPGDTTSDLTCNYWGGPTGEPTAITNVGTEASIYTPWATAPIAGTGATGCSGGL